MSQTVGPWDFCSQEGPRDLTLKRRHFLVGHHNGRGVAVVFGDEHESEPSEDNARLVAASPDLLDACKRLVMQAEMTTDYLEFTDGTLHSACQQARAALLKAGYTQEAL